MAVNSDKHTLFSTEKRVQMIQGLYKNNSHVTVESFEGITTDFAKRKGAEFIIRGIRTSNDFEYEDTVAYVYRKISGIETIFLLQNLNLFISVRQLFVNFYIIIKMFLNLFQKA